MSERDAFVRQIIDEPDDDAPRLVFADWLDDQGEADRAAFIRTQVRRAALAPDDPEQAELQAREWRLLLANAREWLGEDFDAEDSDPLANSRHFRRGFVERVGLTAAAFLDRCAELCRSHPVTNLALLDLGSDERLAHEITLRGWQLLSRLRRLRLPYWLEGGTSADAALALLRSPALAGLRALELSEVSLGGRLAELAACPAARGLTELSLYYCGCRDEDLPALFDLPLTSLDVSQTGVTPAGLAAVAASPLAGRLTRLGVVGLSLRGGGAEAITDLLERCPLRSLAISDSCDLEEDEPASPPHLAAFDALLAVKPWPGPLRELSVSRVSPDLARWRLLLAHPSFGGLTSLTLSGVGLSLDVLDALADCGARLRSLTLVPGSDLALNGEAVERLVDAPLLDGITSLTLLGLRSPDEALARLICSPALRGLRRLWAGGTGLDLRFVRALAEQGPPGLTSLSLAVDDSADEAIEILAASRRLPCLTYLALRGAADPLSPPQITERGLRKLLEGPPRLYLAGLDWRRNESPLHAAYRERFGRVNWAYQLPDAVFDQ